MLVDKQIINSTMKLNPKEKFFLIELLVQSIDKPDPAIDKIWLKEAESRLKAHRDGKSKGIPAEIVLEGPL